MRARFPAALPEKGQMFCFGCGVALMMGTQDYARRLFTPLRIPSGQIPPDSAKMPSEAVFMRGRVQALLHGRF
jgi:hypothetical protein